MTRRYYYRLLAVRGDQSPYEPGEVVSAGDWVEAATEDEAIELIADQQMWAYEEHGPTEHQILW